MNVMFGGHKTEAQFSQIYSFNWPTSSKWPRVPPHDSQFYNSPSATIFREIFVLWRLTSLETNSNLINDILTLKKKSYFAVRTMPTAGTVTITFCFLGSQQCWIRTYSYSAMVTFMTKIVRTSPYTLSLTQNGHHFTDIFKRTPLDENVRTWVLNFNEYCSIWSNWQ